jgi:outer membrane protein assembly factor BamD (BamD/ComL family)
MHTTKLLNAIICFSVLLVSCTPSTPPETGNPTAKKEQLELIRKLEKEMHASTTLNAELGKSAVQQYLKYAALYPEDSVSADFLFKGGEVATAIQAYPNALHCYEMITTSYPTFVYARESLYLQGYLFDNFMNDDAKAKKIYEQFLAKYSSGNYVTDAKAAITNLGKTDEELIKEFEKKNAKLH